jgi:hypothetical protein
VSGERPKKGVRYALDRGELSDAHVRYEGFVHLPDADVPVSVRVDLPALEVRWEIAPGSGDAERIKRLGTMAGALVRAAVRSATAASIPPPRRIVRWRP